jgi:hypothetical protein
MLEQQAAVGHVVGHPPGVHAPLQIPALEVADRDSAEVEVDKLTHFSQLTLVRAGSCPGRALTQPARNI